MAARAAFTARSTSSSCAVGDGGPRLAGVRIEGIEGAAG